ncbi:hypothetical protein KAU09_00230 [Candidatus Parcubacteria bacterium]|nr:hypothetical protein [Candidatus Parcubacteria bacterium]
MKTAKKQEKMFKILNIMLIAVFLFSISICVTSQKNTAQAAANLIKESSFEGDIDAYWGTWQEEGLAREFEFYRAYNAPYGYGSYCAAIDAKGTPGQAFSALLSSGNIKNKFAVDATKDYYLIFYARSTVNMDLIAYMQRADSHDAITEHKARTINSQWQKYVISLSPTVTTDALLAFVYGDMPDNATLYLDGIQVIEANLSVATAEVRAYIGDEKYIAIRNINNFSENDINIEVPYYDNLTKTATTKKISIKKMTSSNVYFDMEEGTYSGIGNVYVNDNYVGSFNYNVLLKLNAFHPGFIRVDEDMVVSGSGFMPMESESVFLVVNALNEEKRVVQKWIEPITMDSKLSQMSFKLPVGTISGSMFIQTSFFNKDGVEKINKSNSLSYKLKPIVFATDWSKRGYEHVGDKLRIYGKGLGTSPSVVYYDAEGNKLDIIRAKVISIGDLEEIEVPTTKKSNSFDITILSNGVESDRSEYLSYLAKPKLKTIKTKYSRVMYSSSERIQAAKIGDEITINGEGFRSSAISAIVEFQGYNQRIIVNIDNAAINANGTQLKVIVPLGAQNGYINVRVNEKGSNYMPIEIIPTVISVSPDPVVPGENIIITADGVGDNLNLAKIHFQLNSAEKITVAPYAIDLSGAQAVVYAKAPMAMSNNATKVTLQYDRWSDDGSSVLNVRPHISGANINIDNKILSIKGYGFSINPRENIITYKYADEDKTVITPNVRMLGVYPTEEGQEIRVQILDNYHYGFVSVQVGDYASNEVNFGPTSIHNIARRIEYVESASAVKGVLYISGYNFGTSGEVYVGDQQAQEHYRSEFFIIAVIDEQYIDNNPIVVTRE